MKVAKKRRRIDPGKTRPRQHIIADMSESHLDTIVHECGFTIEHFRKDYGYDAFIKFFDDNGQFENGEAYVQLKATDKIRKSADGQSVLYTIATRDIKLWEDGFMPMYLVLYDAVAKVAYWVYLQQYLERNRIRAASLTKNSKTIRINVKNILSVASVKSWKQDKDKAMKQIKVRHA
jgi:Domain of unknown function (DUF4365)